MSNEAIKKLTFDDLIRRKTQREEERNQTKEIEAPSMGGTLVFSKPDEDEILNIMDKLGDNRKLQDVAKAYRELIYNCCNMLHDDNLQKEYGVVDPYDIVDKIFTKQDILKIGNELTAFSGVNSNSIKN